MTATAPPSRVALVTGASRGLGRTLAGFLSAERYTVVLTARGRLDLEHAATVLAAHGAGVRWRAGDVTDPEHRKALVGLVRELGRLDLLVNNASELGPSPLPTLGEYPLTGLRRVLETNLVAPLALLQDLLPWLELSHGRVVNLSSDAALGGYPGWGGYGASKAALDLISRTLGEELKTRRVSVVSVDPGDLRTTMHQAAYPGQDISDRPLPEVTLPFWAWLLQQDPALVSGHRFRAQADRWEVPS